MSTNINLNFQIMFKQLIDFTLLYSRMMSVQFQIFPF